MVQREKLHIVYVLWLRNGEQKSGMDRKYTQ